MARAYAAILGIGLGILWLVAINSPAERWLAWGDLVLAGAALALAAFGTRVTHRRRTAGPVVITTALTVLWIVGLFTRATPWLVWWNFIFAAAFAGLALSLMSGRLLGRGQWGTWGARQGIGAAGQWPVSFYGGMPPFGWGQGWGTPGTFRSPRNYTRSDERIRDEINERLAHHWMIDPTDVEVVVADGVVTLLGTVLTRHERRIAEEITDSVFGVRDVHNQLVLRRSSPSSPERAA